MELYNLCKSLNTNREKIQTLILSKNEVCVQIIILRWGGFSEFTLSWSLFGAGRDTDFRMWGERAVSFCP